jgi:hypothetical protein
MERPCGVVTCGQLWIHDNDLGFLGFTYTIGRGRQDIRPVLKVSIQRGNIAETDRPVM